MVDFVKSLKCSPEGKSLVSKHALDSAKAECEAVSKCLKLCREILEIVILANSDTFYLWKQPKEGVSRTSLEYVPERLAFRFSGIEFYVDFVLDNSSEDDTEDITGVMVYGVSRPYCFSGCISESGSEEGCASSARCDRLEDKPLHQLTVTKHSEIRSAGALDGKWCVRKKEADKAGSKSESDLLELHFRIMELIWHRAVKWTNESILP